MSNSKLLCRKCKDYHRHGKEFMGFCSNKCKQDFAIDYYNKEREKRKKNAKSIALKKATANEAEFVIMKRDYKKRQRDSKSKRKPAAQKAFNKYIRLRDKASACISCGRVNVEWTVGGKWDCGHYHGVGKRPDLRFNEDNAHKQCKSCNGGSAKYARKNYTVEKEYRIRLIKKIGKKRVLALDVDNNVNKDYTAEEYKTIELLYKNKAKEYN